MIAHERVARRWAEGVELRYELSLLNWGSHIAHGILRVQTEVPEEPAVEMAFNSPDCDDGCSDPAGDLRDRLVSVIREAKRSLDVAIYGLDDIRVLGALCDAAARGVVVRAVTDETSEDPNDSRSYHPALFSTAGGLAGCGARVEAVRSYGLMHDKFLIIDRGTEDAVLVTGSANFTVAGFELNHNHLLFLRGVPGLVDAFQAEMDQLLRHCASDRLDGREARCAECSPACTEDRTPIGPWPLSDGQVEAYFSPSDDPLRALRGESREVKLPEPDPACLGPDATCACRPSGRRWSCSHCAEGDDGWGLVGDATERIAMTMYSATDACFALGLARAARRGVEVLTVWDFVKAGSPYSLDDWLCAEGIPTYITNWGNGSAQVRNHNKIIVIDDMVFDGSMNVGASGADENNENSLVIRSPSVAQALADYIASEAALLERSGVSPQDPDACRCRDLVDNDGDGRTDGEDVDCDSEPSPGVPI